MHEWAAKLRERVTRAEKAIEVGYGGAVQEAKEVLAGQVLPALNEAEVRLKDAVLRASEVEAPSGAAPGYVLSVPDLMTELSAWIEVEGDSTPKVMMRSGRSDPVDVYQDPGSETTPADEARALVDDFVDEVVQARARRRIAKEARESLGRTLSSLRGTLG